MATGVPGAQDDLELVRQAAAGDREAFYALVSRYQGSLYRAVLAMLHNAADTEDVLQETFLRAFQHLGQFRGESKFQTWLTQIALNTARMRIRKEHAGLWESLDEPQRTDEGSLPREVPDGRETPEQQYGRNERRALLLAALRGLAPAYREVLALRDIQLRSTQETAKLLGLSEANVKTRLLRARLQLRERLSGHGLGGESGLEPRSREKAGVKHDAM